MGWVVPWPAPSFIIFIFYRYKYLFFVHDFIIYIILCVYKWFECCNPVLEVLTSYMGGAGLIHVHHNLTVLPLFLLNCEIWTSLLHLSISIFTNMVPQENIPSSAAGYVQMVNEYYNMYICMHACVSCTRLCVCLCKFMSDCILFFLMHALLIAKN
jgi:hypothetical protein